MLSILPENESHPYDVREVIYRVVDSADFLEVHADYAQNIVVGLARLGGPYGRHRREPAPLPRRHAGHRRVAQGGAICPLLRLLQHPDRHLRRRQGYLPGTAQEHGGIITHGAKLVYAYSEATVPKVTVILRKAYGGAYIAMGSKHLGGDVNFAWPTGSIAVTGPDAAVGIVFRAQIELSPTAGRELIARLPGALRQPLRLGFPWLHRRRDRPAGHALEAHSHPGAPRQ